MMVGVSVSVQSQTSKKQNDRTFWVRSLTEIAKPVLENLSNNTLKKNMPVETTVEGSKRGRDKVTHLEAVGRLLCGMAPWLELGADNSTEGKLRKQYIELVRKGLQNAVDPNSPDKLNFTTDNQALVDAAFLAQSFLRAPTQIWGNLDTITQSRMIDALKSTRIIKPNESNWLLFSAIIEATLLQITGECKMETINYALFRFDEWYKGDGWYGDGKDFHFDYYNSIVIHPMMLDILTVLKNKNLIDSTAYNTKKQRSIRYAEQLERLISPEGTFPAFGRSLAYRFGVFHNLSQISLLKLLPENVKPAQVRCALTSVIKRQLKQAGTYDKNGWLTLGFCGHQPEIAESYISTGSLYLCSAVFLPLGLPLSDEFWSGEPSDWTNKQVWNGKQVKADHAIKN
ncbi:MAG: DUF2264 domain-containing protein [Paludibacter sp.]